jgi:enoyl-[acyl-carrier protein] reductase II
MFEGNMIDGELEIGQVSARLDNIYSAKQIIDQTMVEFKTAFQKMSL